MIRTDEANVVESPASTVVGTVDATGAPHATRAWGAWVLGGGTRLRFLLPAADSRAAADLVATGQVAFNATVVDTLRSVQVKGVRAVVEPATADDRVLHERFVRELFQALHDNDGSDIGALQHMRPADVVAVECDVESVFDQTPGPSAGVCLS